MLVLLLCHLFMLSIRHHESVHPVYHCGGCCMLLATDVSSRRGVSLTLIGDVTLIEIYNRVNCREMLHLSTDFWS